MRKILLSVISISFLLLTGCTHMVSNDYGQYLTNNQGRINYGHVNKNAVYTVAPDSQSQTVKIHSFEGGIGNTWDVDAGQMLMLTLQSKDMQNSFKSLSQANSNSPAGDLHLYFSQLNYGFSEHKAMVGLHVKATQGNTVLINKDYNADGGSQGGKMYWAGAFGMRNSVQQSSMMAFGQIFKEVLADVNAKLK